MTDYILPPWLKIARTRFSYIDNTGISRSEFTGAIVTGSRGGDRLGASLEFSPAGGASINGQMERAAIKAFLMRLRGRQNRAYLFDPGYQRRGSFPASELLTNNTFENGTAEWVGQNASLAVRDRVMRVTVASAPDPVPSCWQATAPMTQYVPYVLRAMIMRGRGSFSSVGPWLGDAGLLVSNDGYGDYGLRHVVLVPVNTGPGIAHAGVIASSGRMAGDYIEVPWCSLSRCMLVDNGVNILLRSDELDHESWIKGGCTISPNAGTAAPDGTLSAESLVEDGSTGDHYVAQIVSVDSTAQDICVAFAVRAANRSVCSVQIHASGGAAFSNFDLLAGSISVPAFTVGTMTNARSFIANLGAGWYYCCLIARKAGPETLITCRLYAANQDGTTQYTGSNGVTALLAWRATAAQSSVPTRLVKTTTAATTGTAQTGSALHIKGGPPNLSGALLPGDQFEVITSRGSELKIVTAPLDLDAAGLGYLQFEPPLRGIPANDAPVIVHQPMGRFVFSGEMVGWDEEPGVIIRASADFEEAA